MNFLQIKKFEPVEPLTPDSTDSIIFCGHENILATHKNTIELTKEKQLSKNGDCIIGVGSSKACSDLSESLKTYIRTGCKLRCDLTVRNFHWSFEAKGDNRLSLRSDVEIVFRKSDYISERTGAISCNMAAADIPRHMISILRNPSTRGLLVIKALRPLPSEEGPVLVLPESRTW